MSKTISVKAFKSMVEGMDMIGGDDWSPSPEQWKKIREKIELLDETVEVVSAPAVDVPGSRAVVAPVQPVERPVANPDNPWENGTAVMPNTPGGVPEGEVTMGKSMSALTPQPTGPNVKTRTVPRQNQPPVEAPVARVEGEQVKTPDIDSTAGYESPFA